ncbi:MAG TPA: hypothetical protein VL984_08410 [Acidimicrobiales bacterium]|nr:hypothetical protein [Acidimicrobiales bacterium]
MVEAHALLAATNNAPMDWVWGFIASAGFVLVIAVPAAALNARDRKRRREAAAAQPEL